MKVNRIDHGVRSEEDKQLMARLIAEKMPLTVCPLSNLKLCVVNDMKEHNIRRLLQQGVHVTVNSDDPSYFGGYMNDNFIAIQQALDLSNEELKQLAINSFEASFISDQEKQKWIAEIKRFKFKKPREAVFLWLLFYFGCLNILSKTLSLSIT